MSAFGSGHVVVEGDDALLAAAVPAVPGVPGGQRPVIVVSDSATASDALLRALDGTALLVHATAPREVVDRMCDDLRRLARVDLVHRRDQLPAAPAPVHDLPESGAELLAALAAGLTLGQAATALGLSRRTADRRLAATRDALGARSTAEAVARWAAEAEHRAAPRIQSQS